MEAFDRIVGQRGFVADMPATVQHYGGTVEGDAFASQDGQGPSAIAYLHPFRLRQKPKQRTGATLLCIYGLSMKPFTWPRVVATVIRTWLALYQVLPVGLFRRKVRLWRNTASFGKNYLSQHCRAQLLERYQK